MAAGRGAAILNWGTRIAGLEVKKTKGKGRSPPFGGGWRSEKK